MVTICLGAYLSEILLAILHAKEVTLAVNGLLAYKHIRISISWPFKDPLQRKCFTNSRNVSNALERKNEVLPFLYSHKTNVSENDLFVLNVVCAISTSLWKVIIIIEISYALSRTHYLSMYWTWYTAISLQTVHGWSGRAMVLHVGNFQCRRVLLI